MKELLKSLADFNKLCPPIKKDSNNPFFKSRKHFVLKNGLYLQYE
jgi:hypothetical protein